MSEYACINYAVSNGVATIALNAPESLNAFNQQMRKELMQVVDDAERDDTVRVVILTGEGRAFSSGADLSEGMPGFDSFVGQCEAEYKPWLMGIHDSSKVYIAAINGVCAGVASAAALNCDLIVMAEDAYIYQAFSAIGLMPDGGATLLLLERLGYQKAFEMAIDAGKLTAQQCLALNIANKVVKPEALLEEATSWAQRLAEGAPLSQKATKQLMRRASRMSYSEVVDEEARLQSDLIKSEDATNAGIAFLKKQKPVFHGR